MKINIEDFVEKKGLDISRQIFEKYGEYPVVKNTSFWRGFIDGFFGGNTYSRLMVESEVYQRSLHEATAFFINHTNAKWDDKIIETLKFQLSTRLENHKLINKLTEEEILAHVIKINVLDSLLDKDLVI